MSLSDDHEEIVRQLFEGDAQQARASVSYFQKDGSSFAVSQLMRRLSKAADETLTLLILETLINLGDGRAIPAILSCIRHPSEEVRGEALYGVIALSKKSVSTMPTAFWDESPGTFESRKLTQIAYPKDDATLQQLNHYLTDNDPELRIAAAYGVGSLAAKSCAETLQSMALNDPDEDVKTAALYALGLLVEGGDGPSLTFLNSIATQVRSTESQIAVMRTLCFYRPERHLDIFEHYLSGNDERLRQLAVLGLGQTGDPDAAQRLIPCLRDRSSHVRRWAAHALGQLKSEYTIDHLVKACIGASSELRNAIGNALSNFDATKVEEAMKRAVRGRDAELRKAVAYLCMRAGIWVLLETLLGDENPNVRKQATLGLATLHQRDASQALSFTSQALKDHNWKVRMAGIEVIRRIQDPNGLALLNELKDDPNPVVKQAIRRTLHSF